jgi:hypothetical protein
MKILYKSMKKKLSLLVFLQISYERTTDFSSKCS